MKILTIKLNDNPTPNDCPFCGQPTNPNIGAEIFSNEMVVCFRCAAKHAPLLACLISFADFSRAMEFSDKAALDDMLCLSELAEIFQHAERKFGAKWENEQSFIKSPLNTYQSFGVQNLEVKNA